MLSAEKQFELLMRGVEAVYSAEELRARLDAAVARRRPLRVKLGMDPTAPDLHLGHCVVLEKMRQFQDLGHLAVLIIGDYTALIGDPTGQNKTRPMLSAEEIQRNADTYLRQAAKVLDTAPGKLELRRNSEWLARMSFADVVRLTSKMTVARMLERDTFEKRYRSGEPISLHEFLYPLCQGWDSVQIRSDVELGGTDQTFNNLVGRQLQEDAGQPPQVVMILPILEGLDGVEKMSKSKGNYIGVTDSPKDMFGKTMSIPDDLMWKWWQVLFHKAPAELDQMKRGHPMEAKKALAAALVERFHGADAAARARAEFEKQFSQRSYEEVAVPLPLPHGTSEMWIVELVEKTRAARSRSQIRQLIEGGGVTLDGQKITDPKARVPLHDGIILKVGKRTVVRLTFHSAPSP